MTEDQLNKANGLKRRIMNEQQPTIEDYKRLIITQQLKRKYVVIASSRGIGFPVNFHTPAGCWYGKKWLPRWIFRLCNWIQWVRLPNWYRTQLEGDSTRLKRYQAIYYCWILKHRAKYYTYTIHRANDSLIERRCNSFSAQKNA